MASSSVRHNATRTGSAKWGRPRPLHVQHPMAHKSLDIDLTVTGSPTPGLQRGPSRLVQWPPPSEVYEKPESATATKHRIPRATVWRTDHELVDLVKDKLTHGLEGVRQMFRARDPFGNSIVTPEGLFQIIKALVGPITREQFNSFLKAICLHWRSSISFDEFIVRFADNPAVAKFSISEVMRKDKESRPTNAEEDLRNTSMLEWCPFTTAPHAFVVFRRRLQKGEATVRDILPPSCFVSDARIIQPQLRDAFAKVGIRLTDKEFDNLWLKFDPDYNGSVPLKRFYKILDLSSNGLPKSDPRAVRSAHATRKSYSQVRKSEEKHSKTEIQVSSTRRANTSFSVSKVDSFDLLNDGIITNSLDGVEGLKRTSSQHRRTTETKKTTQEVETTTTTKTTMTTKTEREKKVDQMVDDEKFSLQLKSLAQNKDASVLFDNVMDHLNYKFEETYRSLMLAFQLFDFMSDGYISKIDFRRVLMEFGFSISAIDLDAFLHKIGIAPVQGLINYRQFLQKFQSKSESSIASQVYSKHQESCVETMRRIETEETLKAEETEANISDFFHSNYLRLLNLLREKDRENKGIVPAHELRDIIDRVLRINMTDKQFNEVMQQLNDKTNDGDPTINYSNFLSLFDSQPGNWNLKKDGLFTGQKYRLNDIAPGTPYLRLQEKAKTWMGPNTDKDGPIISRVAEIKEQLCKLFRDRFHVFDKNFQSMDRQRTAHMSKWQFGALIKLCGITLSQHDLDHLWFTLDTAADNTLSYSTLVKTFCGVKPSKSASHQSLRSQSKASVKVEKKQSDTCQKVVIIEQPSVESGSAKERKLNSLIAKVKDDVLKRWDVLHSVFLSLDRDGYSSVSVQDMRDISQKMRFNLSLKERNDLIDFFDLKSNGWFYYLSFLTAVKKFKPQNQANQFVFDIHTKRLNRKAGPTSLALTLHDLLTEMKNILLKKHKTLRKAFKCIDSNHNGFIEEMELKKSLKELGYHLCEQDFSDLFQVFDLTHAQRLSYDDFKNTLLTL